ncbi:Aldo/keto reductase [Corchorus capsularis]|uniref:Aldo/keto reductase n=1 Tax=Corchorus capsularis TaxID=210143 RepID=A0A1R3JJ85_COCAP|nr:Aldo/keto reductase [Corchorus capsularis]
MWRQKKLRQTCADHNIHVSAYSPLGGPGNAWGSTVVVENPIIKSIALKHKATPAQETMFFILHYLRQFARMSP